MFFFFSQALEKVSKLKVEVEHLRGGPFIHCLQRVSDLGTLPLPLLRQMQNQLRMDLETLDKVSVLCQQDSLEVPESHEVLTVVCHQKDIKQCCKGPLYYSLCWWLTCKNLVRLRHPIDIDSIMNSMKLVIPLH